MIKEESKGITLSPSTEQPTVWGSGVYRRQWGERGEKPVVSWDTPWEMPSEYFTREVWDWSHVFESWGHGIGKTSQGGKNQMHRERRSRESKKAETTKHLPHERSKWDKRKLKSLGVSGGRGRCQGEENQKAKRLYCLSVRKERVSGRNDRSTLYIFKGQRI